MGQKTKFSPRRALGSDDLCVAAAADGGDDGLSPPDADTGKVDPPSPNLPLSSSPAPPRSFSLANDPHSITTL